MLRLEASVDLSTLHLARTISEMTQSKITVHTKNTKARGIALFFEPKIDLSSRDSNATAMDITSSVYMVNAKKLDMGFGATDTCSAPVSFKGSEFCGLMQPLIISTNLVGMCQAPPPRIQRTFCSVIAGVFSISCLNLLRVFVGHKNTASFQLAALTRQAGQRQLGAIIA